METLGYLAQTRKVFSLVQPCRHLQPTATVIRQGPELAAKLGIIHVVPILQASPSGRVVNQSCGKKACEIRPCVAGSDPLHGTLNELYRML